MADTYAQTYLPATSVKAGAAVEVLAVNKSEKYRDLEQHYIFCPVAVETMGPIDEESLKFLSAIGRHITEISGEPRESQFLFQRLSIIIQRGNAASQLYGSTTVVMAIYGLHWKWRSLTPCQRHPSEPIEKKFGTIDYVIDLNNLAKFGFGKIFRDWGTYTQHIRFCVFFFFFFFI